MNRTKPFLKILLIGLGILMLLLVIGIVGYTVRQSGDSDPPQEPFGFGSPEQSPTTAELQPAAAALPPELGFAVEDSPEPLNVDTWSEFSLGRSRTLCIYDADYLDRFFDYDSVTAEETKQTVLSNPAIGSKYRDLLCWYIDAIAEKYPEADLRILQYNLQTLEVVELESFDLALQTLSMDSYGCYKPEDNKIYVNRDYEFEPGTWEYQVIIHEFGHATRTIQRNSEELDLYVNFSSEYEEIPEEALNSLFTVSLFDYEERDIAYQLPSNLFQVMLECLDDYSLSDYVNHSLSYLAHKLDRQTGYHNYAMTIFRLIGAQRDDHVHDEWERDPSVYYPIYDYVCRLYLDRYGAADMDEAARTALVQELVDRVTYDVPENFPVDTGEFFRFAETWQPQLP